jgi:hypothetical protein
VRSIAKGQTLGASGTVLDVFLTDPSLGDALLRDPTALSFAVFSTQNDALEPQQVFPTGNVEEQVVNLTTHRIGRGHYFAAFTLPATVAVGAAEIHWYFTMASGYAGEIVVTVEVIPGPFTGQPAYCSLSDVRDEGTTKADGDDTRVLKSIVRSSVFIERVTGRWFEPRACAFTLDGDDTRTLILPAPIIAIESVSISYDGIFRDSDALDPSAYRIYARHLTDGMDAGGEDDRNCPRLELQDYSSVARVGIEPMYRWPLGKRNIQVRGCFGFTDPDGGTMGKTPDLIRETCTALATTKVGMLADRRTSGLVTMEKTRDQEVQYSDAGLGGAFTGDPDIDMALESFRRPPSFSVM